MLLIILIAHEEVTVTLIPDDDHNANITIPKSKLSSLKTVTFLPTIHNTVIINVVALHCTMMRSSSRMVS